MIKSDAKWSWNGELFTMLANVHHRNSNDHMNTQELWKPMNLEATTNTRFYIFKAPSEWNKTKNWSALCSMLASRKFLGSPQRLFNFRHRIKPMHIKNFETKDKQTEICDMKDAESVWFVFWSMLVKKWPTPCRFVFQNRQELINRPASSFAAQYETMKMSNIMFRNAKYKVFYELGWLVTFMFPKTGPLGAVHSILHVDW